MNNILKKKIINKDRLYGTHVNLADPGICDIVGRIGYDFIWVDMEHTYLSYEALLSHIIAAKGTGTPVIVRAPQDDLTATKKILEMGVDGIIFPMVRSKDEIDRLIGYTLYPPYGSRGFGPIGAIHYGVDDVNKYVKENNVELCRFIQIEHKDLVDNIAEIAENEYIDGFIFGPN